MDRVVRFSATERGVHWTFAACFGVLLATGLTLWVPSLATLVGQRELVRRVHIVAGLALLTVPAAVAIAGDRRGVLRTLRELDRFDADDRAFLLRRPSRPDRFNGGQRLNSWWTLASAVLFLVSGVVQWRWPWFPAGWRRGASQLHDLLTVSATVVLAGHVYLAALHRTTRPALRGIVTGSVAAEWASAKHPRWTPEDG